MASHLGFLKTFQPKFHSPMKSTLLHLTEIWLMHSTDSAFTGCMSVLTGGTVPPGPSTSANENSTSEILPDLGQAYNSVSHPGLS